MPTFTQKQGQYLAFIYAYTVVMRRSPAEADIQRYFGVTSPTVHQMVLTLAQARLIRRTPHVARSIELLLDPPFSPCYAHRRNRSKPLCRDTSTSH